MSGAAFVVLAVAVAAKETPTVDEYAHVPAGLVHWRQQDFHLDRNNPPLGKMWIALPIALDPTVTAPAYQGDGVGWEPWTYAQSFERSAGEHYLALMFRTRLMTIPLVVLSSWIVYLWSRSLFGRFAGSMSAALFLLSTTILAHGHLATMDVACMTTMLAAMWSCRWASLGQTWTRFLIAGVALGLALAVKFSALLLVPLTAVVLALLIRSGGNERRIGGASLKIGAYYVAAWLTLNASMAFQGTFDSIGSLELRSDSVRSLAGRLPESLPILLPRDYVQGIDALQDDIERGHFRGYLHGQWSHQGWASYYFLAYAIKESEVVVVLTAISLASLLYVRPGWREGAVLLLLPVTFLAWAALANSLCLGIRYILPVFPMLFVLMGSVFTAGEQALRKRIPLTEAALRWWIAFVVLGAQLATALLAFPNYIGYFNRFIGGPAHGADWLVDSNLDWGQDLYRLSDAAKRLGVDRWQLAYFGHVDPGHYGIEYDLPTSPPAYGMYAISANYWKGMRYAWLDEDGRADYLLKRAPWLTALEPTEWVGSIAIVDLRKPMIGEAPSGRREFNLGILAKARGEATDALAHFRRAADLIADWPAPWLQAGNTLFEQKDATGAAESYRKALARQPQSSEAMNNLAWVLATAPAVRDPKEAVRLAQRACTLTGRRNLSYLETLAVALAAAGRIGKAAGVCREAIAKARQEHDAALADSLERTLESLGK